MIRRGEIWWASLPSAGKTRDREPVLIVQANEFNRSRIGTVLAVALISNTRFAEAPGNVLLPRAATGLREPTVANVSQVITLDRSTLRERVRKLSPALIEAVDAGLRLVLAL